MPQMVSQLIAQPWALTALVGVGAFLLGLLIPRRNGSTFLSGIILFLPYLFLDLLDMVHTKKFKYYGLVTALLTIEAFFAFRAATVYYDVLNTRMPGPEMAIVCVIVFVAVFLCGYMVATHGKLTFWSFCTIVFVIIHDWASTAWMNYSQPILSATRPATAAAMTLDQSSNDGLKLVLTIGMCVLGLLPFIMGAWTEELRPQLETELDEEVETFTNKATRQIKRRAVNRVLRLANRTDIVRLVQALPADEFTAFKQFVMPIIAAPGTPYHLTEITEGPVSGQPATGQPIQLPAATGHNVAGQNGSGQPATSHRTATTGQGVGDEDKLDRTVAFLRANPQATNEELAAHLGMSRQASALFYRRKSEEILRKSQQATGTQAVTLGMIERMMYDAIAKLSPQEQAALRVQVSSQSLAEFTRTLTQRYPQFAAQITEARVANVLAYDRQQQAATGQTSEPANKTIGQNTPTGQAVSDSKLDTTLAPATGQTSEPANSIGMAGHRTQRPTGQTTPVAGHATSSQPDSGQQNQPDTRQQEKAATDQAARDSDQASDPQDSKGRIAAYRVAHPTATQKQAGEALDISERTVRRYWKQDEADS